MLGYQPPPHDKLFYMGMSMEKRIRRDHPLRGIANTVDFDFIYEEVRAKYGSNGNVSVPPPVILKLMLLLVLYNVRSERELMETLPERLDWLWFLGYDFDSEIPNHSVLSKARKRWGVEAFKEFFERIVWQCVAAGLVDGRKIFMDASFMRADASMGSVVDTHSLKRYLNRGYEELQRRLDESPERAGAVNSRYVSATDPEASITRRGTTELRYKSHRAVDASHEIITAADVTVGATNEAHMMKPLLDSHQDNTGKQARTVVADSKYGTVENYLECFDRGVNAHIPDLGGKLKGSGLRKGIFADADFTYDEGADEYVCPAGKRLTPTERANGVKFYWAKKADCMECGLRTKCTNNKQGRKLKRYVRQRELAMMREKARSAESKRDIRTRQHLMERSYARATRYGHGRARWRGLWRVRIQEYLTAAVQNIQVLIRHAKDRAGCIAMQAEAGMRSLLGVVCRLRGDSGTPLRFQPS